jgi:hypothetical protein
MGTGLHAVQPAGRTDEIVLKHVSTKPKLMKYEFYDHIKITDDFSIFDFFSVGKNGRIPKRIEFMPTEIPDIVNLAFGDINEDGEIDD